VVREALHELLVESERPFVGVTCLACGADQLFAHAVLDVGGAVEVVLPAADYRERKVKPANTAEFDRTSSQGRTGAHTCLLTTAGSWSTEPDCSFVGRGWYLCGLSVFRCGCASSRGLKSGR
jgi:hypothetical protein